MGRAIVGGSHALLLLAWSSGALAQAQQAAPTLPSPTFTVDVIAATPLPGLDLPLERIPAPVQTIVPRDIAASGALDLSDLLNRRLNNVHVNAVQGNPFQADVNYRGYTASPLLGTPQGVSVYLDGMRLNQPFGDVVSWDLIPRVALASIVVMPGSNPLFGLNTLGGALSIQTKDGRSHSGTAMQATYGSHARRAIEFEHGGSKATGLHWYGGGNVFAERGWRDASPSDVRQLFGKIGWQDVKTDLKLAVVFANNTLGGNGLQEQRLLARDYASVYTKPDVTDNRATSLNLTARRIVGSAMTMSGNVYFRDIRTDTLNGDVNEGSLDQSVYQPGAGERAALAAAGYADVPSADAGPDNTPFPSLPCLANVLLNDEPAVKCNGLLNRTASAQHNYGTAGQVTIAGSRGDRKNQLTMGAAYDGSRIRFTQSTELGYLNPDRSVTGLHAFGDGGVTGGTVDGQPYDARVDVRGRVDTWSLYATDTLSVGNRWHLTVSGRYNRTTIDNSDRVRPGIGSGSLDGRHVFGRLNPAAGVTFTPSREVNAYLGYAEGSRAPTSIELGCADPNQPCRLPNAMAGDPPLSQVVTRTWESGVRGGRARGVQWNIGVFRGENRDDLLFVASTQTGFGYFSNFGRTRRQGLEAGVNRRVEKLVVGAGYTFLDATYQSAETVGGSGNSTNASAFAGGKGLDGTIEVRPGDRIPLIPRHTLKAFADVEATSRLSLDLDLVAVSSAYARGNENNLHQPDGVYYLGPGTSSGYAVVNLGARYRLTRKLQLFTTIDNLLNRRYDTAAQLGGTGFTAGGTFIARPLPPSNGEFPVQRSTFSAPGAPRLITGGLRISL